MSERIGDELRGIDLGDKRLNQRSVKVLEALAANPEAGRELGRLLAGPTRRQRIDFSTIRT